MKNILLTMNNDNTIMEQFFCCKEIKERPLVLNLDAFNIFILILNY